jgi:hypothetical protein
MTRSSTDADWSSLRGADPSFTPTWAASVASSSYDPSLPSANIGLFADHLIDRLKREEATALRPVWLALEALYDQLDHDQAALVLTIGLLECLIAEAEEHRLPLHPIWAELGPRSRDAWRQAYSYTHRNSAWIDHT